MPSGPQPLESQFWDSWCPNPERIDVAILLLVCFPRCIDYRYRRCGVATCSLRYFHLLPIFPVCVCPSIALSSSANRSPFKAWLVVILQLSYVSFSHFFNSFLAHPFSLLSSSLALQSSSVGCTWLHVGNFRERVRRGLRICFATGTAGKYYDVRFCFLH